MGLYRLCFYVTSSSALIHWLHKKHSRHSEYVTTVFVIANYCAPE